MLVAVPLIAIVGGARCYAEPRPAYSVGVVPQFDARQMRAIWEPILRHVSEAAGVRLELHGASGIPAFEREFEQGRYDFAYMNPYHMLIANRAQGYVPLVRDRQRALRGIIVVKRNGGAENIADLAGRIIAFPAPNALGASLLPRAEFARVYGIDFEARFVANHDSVYLNVALGQAEAGGGVMRTFRQQPEDIQNRLRILHKTQPIAPHPFAAHPRVPSEVRDKVRRVLLDLANDESGQALLARIPMRRAGTAELRDYEALKSLALEEFYVRNDD